MGSFPTGSLSKKEILEARRKYYVNEITPLQKVLDEIDKQLAALDNNVVDVEWVDVPLKEEPKQIEKAKTE